MQTLWLSKNVHSLLRHVQSVRAFTLSCPRTRFTPTFDPYSYSQGRWLDQDEKRQQARRIDFDFDALLQVAVSQCQGARQVVACEKKEGGFNRVFIIELDNGAKVVAKVAMPFSGPPGFTTMSEVATLSYVKRHTSLPVPKLLSWSSKPQSGLVGAEYIIMEHVTGVALKDAWETMTELQHIQLIESVGNVAKELCALNFPAFGSIYFNTADKPPGSLPLDSDYCIGPHCGRQHWGYNDDYTTEPHMNQDLQGPWRDISQLFKEITQAAALTVSQRGSSQALVQDHLRLLDTCEKTLELVKHSSPFQEASSPMLFHPDFNARNIFVAPNDPTQVVVIIDWQSTAIDPAFVYAAEPPDFAEEPVLDQTLDADAGGEWDETKAHAQRCRKTWAVMAFLCPKLGKATSLDHDICRYLAGIASGFSDDFVSLRSMLTDLSDKWSALGLPGDTSYRPSQEDADSLYVELDHLQSTQRLRTYLTRLLRCETDGWVETARWSEVVPIYKEQYAAFVESCIASREEDETEKDAKKKADKLWPFDLR